MNLLLTLNKIGWGIAPPFARRLNMIYSIYVKLNRADETANN